MPALSNNGLPAHQDFPVAPYEAVHKLVVERWSEELSYSQFTGAWNAVAYRFHGALDAGGTFQKTLRDFGSHPAPNQRYQQEAALFNFFSNGFSVFEAMFYGLFAIGSFIKPNDFPIATQKEQQRISPTSTADAFRRAFPNEEILIYFQKLFESDSYKQWRDMRNVLTHRAAPGRRVYIGIGLGDAPPVEWKLNNLPLDSSLVPGHQSELAQMTSNMLLSTEMFLIRRK